MNIYESLKEMWLGLFQERGEETIPFFCNTEVSKQVWLHYYKKLPPIEQMPEKEKEEMKRYVIDLFPEKTTQEKIEACKIIYTIGSLI